MEISIPFIAGQWSLPVSFFEAFGIFTLISIPFIAGQWSLLVDLILRVVGVYQISIPFIAGQWSLQAFKTPDYKDDAIFQSPSLRGSGRFLHHSCCQGTHLSFDFNPLHCGAVVASRSCGRISEGIYRVFQSPSLRGSGRFRLVWGYPFEINLIFQSPSLRGSGRFHIVGNDPDFAAVFQSPSLRGSGRFRDVRIWHVAGFEVSIPFIAGQWSLLTQVA